MLMATLIAGAFILGFCCGICATLIVYVHYEVTKMVR